MKTKKEIVDNWLPRYTGLPLERFGKYILLTNFQDYVDRFAAWQGVEVVGKDKPMPCASDGEITIINFSMGSANAATIMDLLGAITPKAVLFLGKCGAVRKNHVGDFILPIAAIRGEGASNDYFPPEVPALPAFMLQRAVSSAIRDGSHDWRKPSPPPSATTAVTIGPGRSTLPTDGCGSMTRSSRTTSAASVASPWIWRRPRSSPWASSTRSPQARSCWYPTSR